MSYCSSIVPRKLADNFNCYLERFYLWVIQLNRVNLVAVMVVFIRKLAHEVGVVITIRLSLIIIGLRPQLALAVLGNVFLGLQTVRGNGLLGAVGP